MNWSCVFSSSLVIFLACTQTLFYFSFRSFRKHRRARERSERRARGARKKNIERLFFSSPTTTSLRWWSINPLKKQRACEQAITFLIRLGIQVDEIRAPLKVPALEAAITYAESQFCLKLTRERSSPSSFDSETEKKNRHTHFHKKKILCCNSITNKREPLLTYRAS